MHPTTQLLEDARKQVTFPIEEMTKILTTPQIQELFIRTQQAFDKEPVYQNNPNYYNLNRKDKILLAAQKVQPLRQNINVDNIDHFLGPISYSQSQAFGAVFYGMVVHAMRILGTDEQIKRWDEDFLAMRIIAAYAQTEIGVGSDVQGLLTTATFDQQADEFIINTPCIEATKFWPGELGLLSNWALVYAQLIIDGKNHGVHPFMVPIRDQETHKPLPGIKVGDIGPKLGYDTKDNGYLSFDHVRVPRSNMLQRYTKVNRDGKVSRQGNEKVSYASMMLIRKAIIFIYPRVAAQAMTIAVRFSIVRQQFKNDKKIENQVIDYQSQQDKLFPLLAKLYAVVFGSLYIKKLVEDNFERVKRKDFSTFQLTHALLSGGKVNYSYFVTETCDWTRLSCGGHGFAHYSGLPGMFFETVPNNTLEGENKVMYLQLARFLMKVLAWSQKSPDRIPEEFKILSNVHDTLSQINSASTLQDLTTLKSLDHFLRQNSAGTLMHCVNLFQSLSAQGVTSKEAWDYRVNDHLIDAASAYMEYFNFRVFQQTIDTVTNPLIKEALIPLAQLYGIHTILNQCRSLIDNALITGEQLKNLKKAKEDLLGVIKKNAIGYVEAFGFSDNHLKTLIGCYDGQPYEKILNWAQNENTMNKNLVAKGIQELKQVKPLL